MMLDARPDAGCSLTDTHLTSQIQFNKPKPNVGASWTRPFTVAIGFTTCLPLMLVVVAVVMISTSSIFKETKLKLLPIFDSASLSPYTL